MWIERLAIVASVVVVLSPFIGYGVLKIIEWRDVPPEPVDARTRQLIDYRRFE